MADIDDDVRVSGLFYKYREFPSDADAERWKWLEDMLMHRKVFFASPRTLNDPFDCFPRIDITSDERELRRRATVLLSEVHTGRGQIITDRIRRSTQFQDDVTQLI